MWYDARMKKILARILLLAIIAVASFYALNAYIYDVKQGDPSDVSRYRGTLTGEVVCLPHADTDGPTTLECAFGMRTDAGEHYALDFSAMSRQATPLDTGDRFTANGLITPIELLSSDHWRRYDIEGVFSVTDSVTKL